MRKEQGFTLIELMIGIGVMGILLAIAIPSFSQMMLNNRSQAQGEELVAALNYTRSEAVKRGKRVSICASNGAGGCGTDWTNGFLVFVDTETSDTVATYIVGTALKQWDDFHDKSSLAAERNGGTINFVRFTSAGMLGRIEDSTNVVTFSSSIDGCDRKNKRAVTVGIAGMVKVKREDC